VLKFWGQSSEQARQIQIRPMSAIRTHVFVSHNFCRAYCNYLSPCSRVLLGKLIITQSKNFSHFMEPKGSLPFTKTCHWSLSSTRCIQSTTSKPFPKIHSNTIFPSMPSSSEWSLLFSFSDQNKVCISYLSNACYMHQPFHPLDLITLKIFGEVYNYEDPHYTVFSSLPQLNLS